ncbi:MMPL family transporter [Nonomuraea sp. NPDC049784]|uniref:MMPL family transporter n=1 Tax=Nonomuraea sp. NPDC049784 TaxID=3154361 RepID=UPI0033DF2A3F
MRGWAPHGEPKRDAPQGHHDGGEQPVQQDAGEHVWLDQRFRLLPHSPQRWSGFGQAHVPNRSLTGDLICAMPITTWVPMMMFPVLFGLSMDYQVFLISRIREEYERTGDTRTAVARGLARTAKVITAAAAIMIAVFTTSLLGPDIAVKQGGLGMAVAVLIDATIVRMILVPAV